MSDILKCLVTISHIFFPKGRQVDAGEWSAFTASVEEVYEGNPQFKQSNRISVSGTVPEMDYYTKYVLIAKLVENETYGKQYEILCMNKLVNLEDLIEQRIFLEHVLSDAQINRLYESLENPFEAIKNGDTETLKTVKGIGEDYAHKIIQRYNDNINNGLAYVELDSFGLTKYMIDKLIEVYHSADTLVSKIKENPYILIEEVDGIGWTKADEMALKSGWGEDSIERISAFITYYLKSIVEDGDTWTTPQELLEETLDTLDIENIDAFRESLYSLNGKGTICWDGSKTKIALRQFYNLEQNIANDLLRLMSAPSDFEYSNFELKIREIERAQGFDFTAEQMEAVKLVLSSQVSIITGFGGCVDCDTEFFDGSQWKKISEWQPKDKVLQYNLDGSTELVEPIKYHKYDCYTMWHMHNTSGSIDQCLSDEHNVVYLSSKGNLNKIPMENLIERHDKSPIGFSGKFITTFRHNGIGLNLSDEQLRLMCAVIADGHFMNGKNRCRINIKKQRKKGRLVKLLHGAGVSFEKYNYNPKDLDFETFIFDAPLRTKEFSGYWFDATQHQLEVLCDEVLHWDGCIRESGRKEFCTTSKLSADFIQFCFSACGHRATIRAADRTQTSKKAKSIEYYVHITQSKDSSVSLLTKGGKSKIEECKTKDGFKYCFSVPSTMLVLRRNNRIFITGNTGKSSVVSGVLKMLGDCSFAQTALSGRAASRLSEITNADGYTIHRLLEYQPPYGFGRNKHNQLPYDVIILDEISMVGAELFYSLIQAVKTGSKLIMIGDDGQLESIGLCNIFKDMLDSNVIPVAKLTKIHRQAAKSAIITESVKVRYHEQLVSSKWVGEEIRGELQDLELNIYNDAILSQKRIIEKFNEIYEKCADIEKIQIVVPMKHRGEISTLALNGIVQNIVNPLGKNEIEITNKPKKGESISYKLREGDKVIVSRNNYKTKTAKGDICPVFNGNKGIIKTIDSLNNEIKIDFEQWGLVVIKRKDWKTIELGYALTCHKLQGSESDYVIIGLDYSCRALLTKEWLYTAITRAKKYCVLCAETNALSYCITNSNVPYKRTFLQEMLRIQKEELVA